MLKVELPRIIDKLREARNILILTPAVPAADDLAAALALQAFLAKLEKDATLAVPGRVAEKYSFLPGFHQIKTDLVIAKSFVIDVSMKRTGVDELSYKKNNGTLSIYIKPKEGQLTRDDVSFRTSESPFDLIVCVGVSALETLGEVYTANTELFFETPVINIDFKPANESYGQFNLVVLAATSNSEIVFDLINGYESGLLDQPMATALLAGIISETNSFQHSRTTPAAFLKASHLVNLGADQQAIVGRLYKTKSLGFLKLWGRVLARIKQDPALSLVYSTATRSDLTQAEASSEDIEQIIKEMSFQLSFAKIFVFLAETGDRQTTVSALSTVPLNLNQMFAAFRPEVVGHVVRFRLNTTPAEAEAQVLARFKEAVT